MKTAQINDDKIIIKDSENLKLNGKKGAIVKILGCGLCGSDIVKFREKISPNGTVLGHEIVAQILEINSDTEFQTNDKIVSSHHIPCFECYYCKNENYSMCEHFKRTNIIPGGFSEQVYLSEEHLKNVAYLIPNSLSEIEASFYEPLGCCVRAIKRCQLNNNSKVLVIGLGSIGLLMTQALKAYGFKVFGCDLIEERINIAKNLGIDAFNSLDIEDSYKYIISKTQIGVDAIFMTSGADKALELALKNIRNGGKILVFSSTPKNYGYANNEIYYRELTVMGSYSPSPEDLKDSLNLLATKKVLVDGISSIYNLSDIQKAFDDTVSNKIMKAYIKIG